MARRKSTKKEEVAIPAPPGIDAETMKAIVKEAVKAALEEARKTPPRIAAREAIVEAAGGETPQGRRWGSHRELERRRLYTDALIDTLKSEGVLTSVNNLGAYVRIDLTAGTIALRGRHVLIRQYDVAPEHPHVKKLLDTKEADAYYMGALAVAFIDDFRNVDDVRAWATALAANVRTRAASLPKK